uniref:ubiquitinyl hydrolase 1 n=1 Tax=Blastobotrys adeninivorans TaxID=409370 RepID=A0A060TBF4_BLAAD
MSSKVSPADIVQAATLTKGQQARRRLFKAFFGGRIAAHVFTDDSEALEATRQLCAALRGEDDATDSSEVHESNTSDSEAMGDDLDDTSVARLALDNNYANGDADRATELLKMFKDAVDGFLAPFRFPLSSSIAGYYKLQGSDNLKGVTCYIDSLLFAMFARLSNFEPILLKDDSESGDNNKTENLRTFLRLYVSMLRSGRKITTDVTKCLLDAIIAAGWKSTSHRYEQQDTAELFQFITSKLNMPLLTLKVDIVHAGKEVVEDDHKLIQESLLHIPVPGEPSDGPVLLEECLEAYFANDVQVTRQIERRRTLDSEFSPIVSRRKYSIQYETSITESKQQPPQTVTELSSADAPSPLSPRGTFDSVSGVGMPHEHNDNETNGAQEHTVELASSQAPSPKSSRQSLHSRDSDQIPFPEPPSYDSLYASTSSPGRQAPPLPSKVNNPLWNAKNEITLPAWMFLQLLPFYTDSQGSGTTESEGMSPIAQHFAHSRPVMGISLKRYSWSPQGTPVRNDRRVVVPREINLPSFVADDKDGDGNVFGNFKLVLESAVFHRGKSLNSGHFVSMVAEDATMLSEDPPQFYDRRLWRRDSNGSTSSDGGSANGSMSNSTGNVANSATGVNASSLWRRMSLRTKSAETLPAMEFNGVEVGSRRWIMFDDLKPMGEKVYEVDFDQVMGEECPYLLFYRMVQVDDSAEGDSMGGSTIMSKTPSDVIPPAMSAVSFTTPRSSLEVPSADDERVARAPSMPPRRRSYHTLLERSRLRSAPVSPERPHSPERQEHSGKGKRRHHHRRLTSRDRYKEEKCAVM